MSYKQRRQLKEVVERVVAPREFGWYDTICAHIVNAEKTLSSLEDAIVQAEGQAEDLVERAEESAQGLLAHAQAQAASLTRDTKDRARQQEKKEYAYAQEILKKQATLDTYQAALDADRDETEDLQDEADRRDIAVTLREGAATQKEAEIENHESILKVQAEALDSRAVRLDRSRSEVESREDAQEAEAKNLAEAKGKVAVDAQIAKNRMAESKQREKNLLGQTAQIKLGWDKLNAREMDVKAMEIQAQKISQTAHVASTILAQAEKEHRDRARRADIRDREMATKRREFIMEQEDHEARVAAFNRRKAGGQSGK